MFNTCTSTSEWTIKPDPKNITVFLNTIPQHICHSQFIFVLNENTSLPSLNHKRISISPASGAQYIKHDAILHQAVTFFVTQVRKLTLRSWGVHLRVQWPRGWGEEGWILPPLPSRWNPPLVTPVRCSFFWLITLTSTYKYLVKMYAYSRIVPSLACVYRSNPGGSDYVAR